MKLLDGGFGTTLRDTFNNEDTTIWSLRPLIDGNYQVYTNCYQLFIDAGCDIITTANYCATPYYLNKYQSQNPDKNIDIEKQLVTSITKLGEIAYNLKNKNPNLSVAGCLPPYAESYDPTINVSNAEIRNHYKLTARCLSNYCDFYLAENISSYREALLIYQSMDKKKPLYLSFCVKSDGSSFLDGSSILGFLEDINFNVTGIMFNCSPIDYVDLALKKTYQYFKDNNIKLQVGAYPNRHQHTLENFKLDLYGKTIKVDYQDLTPEQFGEYAESWIDKYNLDIGGCCGIGPEYINEVSNRYLNGI